MSELIRFWVSAALTVFGLVCIFFGILGVFKFRFVMNRMHCAAILDTLGIAGIACALMVAGGSMAYIPKLLCVLIILWIGSPIASHLVGRLEIMTDDDLTRHMQMEGGQTDDPD